MKRVGRIYRWVVISVMIQTVLLAYLNFIYLPGRNTVKATMLEFSGRSHTEREIIIPQGAEHIKVSYDGLYAAYVLNNDLAVVNTRSGKKIKTIKNEGSDLSYYKWLPDRDMVIYSLKPSNSEPGYVQIVTFDIDAEMERNYPEIEDLPKGSEVTAIELSPLTNIVYVKIKTGEKTAGIYKFNIMDELKFVMKCDNGIILKETAYSDNLVYQDNAFKIYVRDGRNNSGRSLGFKNKTALLGIDSEDRVYVGELNKDNLVAKIRFGKLDVEPAKSWEQFPLEHPVPPGKLIINSCGTVFILAEKDRCIHTVDGSFKLEYTGKFVEILNDYLVYREDSKLKIVPLRLDDTKELDLG